MMFVITDGELDIEPVSLVFQVTSTAIQGCALSITFVSTTVIRYTNLTQTRRCPVTRLLQEPIAGPFYRLPKLSM
jgi:hypothetical protein